MAIQIPNFFECGGSFDGRSGAAFPILSANGILPLDINTTPSHPAGGFTRVIAGQYEIGSVRKYDGEEVVLLAQFIADSHAAPGPGVGAAPSQHDGFSVVQDISHDSESGVDFAFFFAVLRIAYGPDGTLSSEP